MSNTVVRTNMLALNSHRNLGNVSRAQAQSSARLSSGHRINSAADDAAGLGISEVMRSQIRGLDQAARNANDGISMIQTAEGGLNTINDMVGRIRELVVQGANDTNVDNNRGDIVTEITQLLSEIQRTADTVEFNTQSLLNATTTDVDFQVGANQGQSIQVAMPNVIASVHGALTNTAGLSATSNHGDWTGALTEIDSVLSAVTTARADLGAVQNRLEFTIQNLEVSSENLSAANMRIRDTDMAAEMMRLTQANVLQQAATSMLAQGNQAPQSVLQLLG